MSFVAVEVVGANRTNMPKLVQICSRVFDRAGHYDRHRKDREPTRPHHSPNLGDRALIINDMLKNMGRQDNIVTSIPEWQITDINFQIDTRFRDIGSVMDPETFSEIG